MVSRYEEMISLYVCPKLLDRPYHCKALSFGHREFAFGSSKLSTSKLQDLFLAIYYLTKCRSQSRVTCVGLYNKPGIEICTVQDGGRRYERLYAFKGSMFSLFPHIPEVFLR